MSRFISSAFIVLFIGSQVLFSACGSSDSADSNGSLSAVTGLTITPGNNKLDLVWDDVEGATSYNIYWEDASASDATGRAADCSGDRIEGVAYALYTHTGLTNGVTYNYVVTAVDNDGNEGECGSPVSGAPFASSSGAKPKPKPATPAPVNGVCGTAHNKTYLFTDTSYGADTFCTAGTPNPNPPAFPAPGFGANWSCDGVNGGTNTACNAQRNRDTTPPITTAPLTQTGATLTSVTGSATIDKNGTGYCIAWESFGLAIPTSSQVKNGSHPNVRGVAASMPMTAGVSATCTITGLLPDINYEVYFVAEDTSGNLQADNSVSRTMMRTLATVKTLMFVYGASTDTKIWTVVKTDIDATGYCVAVPAGQIAPTVSQIAAMSGGVIVGTGESIFLMRNNFPGVDRQNFCSVTGLTANTAYDLYFVAESFGRFQLSPTTVSNIFTTLPQGTAPAGMAAVLGGCFMMGDTVGGGFPVEYPVHPVCLSSYFIDSKEVTQAEHQIWGADTTWSAYGFDAHPYCGGSRGKCPAESVDWANASAYCAAYGKRLPTEAEWEYAARERGAMVKYGTGADTISCATANGRLGPDNPPGISTGCITTTSGVGSYAPNILGLFDMSGNVGEWVADFGDDPAYYSTSPITDPTGPAVGWFRGTRGGNWNSTSRGLRASGRGASNPNSTWGFRCVSNTTLPPVSGCTDPVAINYSDAVRIDNGSCVYDTTPPTTTGWAKVSNTPTTWVGSATISESGYGYCTALVTGSPPPTSAEVKANNNVNSVGTSAGALTLANTPTNCVITGLTADATYDFYFVAEDGLQNLQAAPSAPITTIIPPLGMVTVLGGCFMMGDNFAEGTTAELPVHQVCLTQFYLDATEVTQEAYIAWGGDLGHPGFAYPFAGHPAERVDWANALAYCAAQGKRLPTEAEWEYAARNGGQVVRYGTGSNTLTCGIPGAGEANCLSFGTTPVGSYPLNALGLFDMSGNVLEWVSDWWGTYPAGGPFNDPVGAPTGVSRVLRGGSLSHNSTAMRASTRFGNSPGFRGHDIGFRCASY